MSEPYFEENPRVVGAEKYPFFCKMNHNNGLKYHVAPHWHNYIEILFVVLGELEILIKGEKYILEKGDLIWIHSQEVHSTSIAGGVHTCHINLQVMPTVFYFANRTVFEARYILPLLMANKPEYNVFNHIEVENSCIPSLMNEILEEYNKKEYAFELAVLTGINRLFLWVLRYWKQKNLHFNQFTILSDADLAMLEKLIKYIEQNYSEDMNLKDIAKMCGMSYSYFSRYFKKIMGKTFSDYLNFIRITEAEKLLLATNMNVTETAMRVGFTNPSYFIKKFKSIKGISPKQYKDNAFYQR